MWGSESEEERGRSPASVGSWDSLVWSFAVGQAEWALG